MAGGRGLHVAGLVEPGADLGLGAAGGILAGEHQFEALAHELGDHRR